MRTLRASVAGLSALAILLSNAGAASAAAVKHLSGTRTAASCGHSLVPYGYAYAVGAMLHKAPGAGTVQYTNLGWQTRGYYGPGGGWSYDANSPSAYVDDVWSGATCRSL